MPIFFHGTSAPITAFSAEGRGHGFEANSVLGLWLTSIPARAVAYAPAGYVLTVETPPLRMAMADEWTTTVWGDPRFNQDDFQDAYEMFEAARERLMAHGYDGVFCDIPNTDLEGALCLFRPEQAVVRATLRADDAQALAQLRADGHGVHVNLEAKLDYVLSALRPDLAHIEPGL